MFEYVNEWISRNTDWRGFEIEEQCYIHGFYTWEDTIDDDGNLLDSIKIITVYDLQAACNAFGIDANIISY